MYMCWNLGRLFNGPPVGGLTAFLKSFLVKVENMVFNDEPHVRKHIRSEMRSRVLIS